MLWAYVLAIIIGYFIGSISPAYLIGKLKRGIDIRKYGSKNAGAMNAFHILGKKAGIATLVFDLAKGVLAILIAYLIIIGPRLEYAAFIGTPFIVCCIAGFAAIIGHNWPFYMQFKGGKGAATAGGILLLLVILLFKPYFFTAPSLFVVPGAIPLIIIGALAVTIVIITGSGNLGAFIGYPAFILAALLLVPNQYSIAFAAFFVYSWVVAIINVVQQRKIDIRFSKQFKKRKREIKLWRKILRFVSLIFPILYFWLDKNWILILIAVFFTIFLILDFVRMKKRGALGLYKKQEAKISGFTWFLLGALIATAFFQRDIVILALIFAAVGDNFAVLLGIPFGRHRLFKDKSVQGTVACLATSFAAGLIVMPFLNVHLLLVLYGAIAATVAEVFSGWYDNITMAPFAAAVMALLLRFFP